MQKLSVIITSLLLMAATASGQEYRYSVGAGGSLISFTGGSFMSFDQEPAYALHLGHRLGESWRFDLSYAAFEFSNDTARDSTMSIGDLSNNSPLDFQATRLSLMFKRLLFHPLRRSNLFIGFGGGPMFWKATDPATSTTYKVRGEKQETTDLAATELVLSAGTGLLLGVSSRWTVQLGGQADYLTGGGAEFEEAIKSARDRWLLSVGAVLSFHFGRSDETGLSDRSLTLRPRVIGRQDYDSDMDGVPDSLDLCLGTPPGISVDRRGCPVDSDFDGVPDGKDDCPGTAGAGRNAVDVYGCPVDADFDGIPDYLDACPENTVGALVDSAGCPLDSDRDGIPDGLDDCPYTLVGVAVDPHGCIDLSMFSKPMVLDINYISGSFEIDPRSQERLKTLAGLLNFVTDMKLDISGYTDDIGTTTANKRLSEKRARRVRDYLERQGVAGDRMKVYGRGESNFIASNQTAEGRAKNRRIEITFYK